ncbi:hypothetical protein CONLIGDRAFT_158226 [Coniochaeta ligniaria NRRL 30616]|uniref:Mid2 domain-containing protein n=1 Tax=Coniochaeta ligniaria NRRL 30616 TaxID=1408157 RepID=A0A1J7JYP9_9PEZI|nr:hypothetical protein CONLIGDRAFT_158226 [Coniochaeta ligniaria NRRL 30616]
MAIINQRQILRFWAAGVVGSEADALAARQNPVVTQIITRPYTTITALVTLGPGDPTSTAPQTTTIPTSTTASPSSSTTAIVAVPGSPPASSSTLTHAQLGAILGSVLGSLLLIILIWYCVTQRRRSRDARELRYVLSEESETSSETVEVTMTGAGGGARRMAADPWVRRVVPEVNVVPPPPRFPPTPRYTPYRQTRAPQIRGVRRYP